jgi:putative acetyltransferase
VSFVAEIMMMEPTLRKPTVDDVDAMWRVRKAAILSVSDSFYPIETIRHWANVSRPDDFTNAFDTIDTILCECNSEPIGWGFANLDVSHIAAMFVSPNWHRRGIGSLITKRFEEMATDRDLENLELSSTLNAVAFYEHRGFESLGKIPYNHPNGFDLPSVRMRKWLRKT